MPAKPLRKKPPKYCHHKATGQAYVTVDGRRIYLGKHGSAESHREYQRILAQLHSDPVTESVRRKHQRTDLTIGELLAAFRAHALTYYRRSDGSRSSEVAAFSSAAKPLRDMYGTSMADEFGPIALKAVREQMVKAGWSRVTVNNQVGRIRRIFRWGVENELVPESVHSALAAVAGLKRGRTEAREGRKVRPVPEAHVDAIRPYVSRQVWALIQIQRLTGARAGELLHIRAVDIDTSGTVWTFAPESHKTEHHGHDRVIYLGPKAQAMLRPFMADRPIDAYLFSPKDAEAERLAQRHDERRTPITVGNRPGSNRRRRPRRRPGDFYTTSTYRRAIQRACDQAFPHPDLAELPASKLTPEQRHTLAAWRSDHRWHPHQLRHNAATELRREFGIETARIILGHKSAGMTEIYAEIDRAKAIDVMGRIG